MRAAVLGWTHIYGTGPWCRNQQMQRLRGDIWLLSTYFRELHFPFIGDIFLFEPHLLLFLLILRFFPLLNQEFRADPWRLAQILDPQAHSSCRMPQGQCDPCRVFSSIPSSNPARAALVLRDAGTGIKIFWSIISSIYWAFRCVSDCKHLEGTGGIPLYFL